MTFEHDKSRVFFLIDQISDQIITFK